MKLIKSSILLCAFTFGASFILGAAEKIRIGYKNTKEIVDEVAPTLHKRKLMFPPARNLVDSGSGDSDEGGSDEADTGMNNHANECDPPKKLEALPSGTLGHVARHAGWGEPCYVDGCYYYCHWCDEYTGKSKKSSKKSKKSSKKSDDHKSAKHHYGCDLYYYKYIC